MSESNADIASCGAAWFWSSAARAGDPVADQVDVLPATAMLLNVLAFTGSGTRGISSRLPER